MSQAKLGTQSAIGRSTGLVELVGDTTEAKE
jgi:hypothetical protein